MLQGIKKKAMSRVPVSSHALTQLLFSFWFPLAFLSVSVAALSLCELFQSELLALG